ncbi:MAG TPA: ABC-type transport auxiliary lipoprotein family protein [Bryobacteraceae bacterium]|jgi:ABC-type uncharacterized transport system auxiliary subunit|nr:ABC-type transport auxiliary lipoprotein family protein [Bryobacteraceae bacterium]
MTRTSFFVSVLLALPAFVTTGCAPHRIQYYQITAAVKPAAPSATGPVVLVGRIATPQALEDGRIRYREGLNQVGGYEFHRWTDPPGIMVKDSLIHVLRASGKYRSVQDAASSAQGDYAVRGKLLEFSELDGNGIMTRISLDLELREAKTGRLVWSGVLTHDDPVQAKKVADVVQSLDRNLQVVLGEASTAIGDYVSGHTLAAAN